MPRFSVTASLRRAISNPGKSVAEFRNVALAKRQGCPSRISEDTTLPGEPAINHTQARQRAGEGLIACPVCDVLHEEVAIPPGMRASCQRCGTVLVKPRRDAMTQIVMQSATAATLMIAAVFFPFLELQAGGLIRKSSVFDAVMAFSQGAMAPLSAAVAASVVIFPFVRFCAIAYALGPMAIGWYPARYAVPAMRWAERMQPWAMAEIFIVGVAVALVKVARLAKVTLGPAFWAFAALVIIVVLKDNLMCKLSVWKTLEERRRS